MVLWVLVVGVDGASHVSIRGDVYAPVGEVRETGVS